MLSLVLCYKHLQHYSRPLLQRQIVRIIVIVPVYALCSALSLTFEHYVRGAQRRRRRQRRW